MLQWTAAAGPRFMGIVHHTDAQREWAYDRKSSIGRLDKALDEGKAKGWTVVGMKQGWKVIYPFENKEGCRPRGRRRRENSSRTGRSDEFDPCVVSGGRGQRGIAGKKGSSESFGEGEIGRVVGGDGVSEFPDPGQEEVVRIASEREVGEVFKSLQATSGFEFAGNCVAPKDLGDFNV